MQLVINLSMLSASRNGQNVYSEYCAAAISQRFDAAVIGREGALPGARVLLQAPASIALGGGKLAAIRRQLWMRQLRLAPDTLLYSPSHHGPSGVHGQIITIHDLICLRFPSQHRLQYLFFKYGLPLLLKKCRAVFTVSETTRQDIVATYRYPAERVFVVPNGVDSTRFALRQQPVGADPYFLMVGARYPHKNVHQVLQMAPCWARDFRLVVVSCGARYREQLLSMAGRLGIAERIEFRDNVAQADLTGLYQGAAALLYPSGWEGFGIPPLEALACGTPVLVSDIPVHREVLGDAAAYVRLGDADSWREGFRQLADSQLCASRLAAARARLEHYTWQHSADILQRALLQVEPRLEQTLLGDH